MGKVFLGEAECGEICFFPLKTKKTAFFAEIFKSLPTSDTHACVGKVRATLSKIDEISSVLPPF